MIQAIIPILFAMMYNSTQYEPIEYPTPLFEQTELNVCLENDQDHKTYLKHVALYAPVNCPYFLYGSEMEDPLLERKDGEKLGWKRMQRRSPLRQGCGDGALQHLRSIVPRRLLENDRGTPYQQKQSLDPHTQTDKFRTQKRQVPICRTIGQRAADSRESVEACAKGRG